MCVSVLQTEIEAIRDDIAPTWLQPPLSLEQTAAKYVRPALQQVCQLTSSLVPCSLVPCSHTCSNTYGGPADLGCVSRITLPFRGGQHKYDWYCYGPVMLCFNILPHGLEGSDPKGMKAPTMQVGLETWCMM